MRRRELLNASNGGNGRKMIGNYEVVDLGLPSGLLWATCNVGTSSETGYGYYYMYGKGSRQYNSSDSYYTGTENPLASTADTATKVMGSGWRMPTLTELQELIDNTEYQYADVNGIRGGKFTSKTNPNAYVFFPAAGSYVKGSPYYKGYRGHIWSSTPNSSGTAYVLESYTNYDLNGATSRAVGLSVRGVHD